MCTLVCSYFIGLRVCTCVRELVMCESLDTIGTAYVICVYKFVRAANVTYLLVHDRRVYPVSCCRGIHAECSIIGDQL